MAVIHNKMIIEMYPTTQDVCEIISAVTAFYPGEEEKFLESIQDAVAKRLEQVSESKQEQKNK